MTEPNSLNVLDELAVHTPQGPLSTAWNERHRGLYVALAISPDGLGFDEQWQVMRGTAYSDERDRTTLNADRSRWARAHDVPIDTGKTNRRSRLGGVADEAIDARCFVAACAAAENAAEEQAVYAWRTALEIWPRSRPLREVHPYVLMPTIFDELESLYRRAVIAFGEAVASESTPRSEDLREFKLRGEPLLTELELEAGGGNGRRMRGEMRTDQRSLRYLLLRLKYRDPMPERCDDTETYIEHYLAQCGYVCPQRLPHNHRSEDIVVPLNDVFISLTFGPETSDEVLADHELVASDEDEGLVWSTGTPPGKFDSLIREKRWSVVLGDPGSGKTTMLQWLALQHARAIHAGEERVRVSPKLFGLPDGEQIDLGLARLPVFVSLGEYAESATVIAGEDGAPPRVEIGSLREFLPHHSVLEQGLPVTPERVGRIISTWLEADRLLLLLDGVDEVRDTDVVAEVTRRVTEFCREHVADPSEPAAFDRRGAATVEGPWRPQRFSEPADSGGSQVVVTSREGGYGRSPLRGPFTIVKTCDLGDSEVARFVRGWVGAVEAWQAQGIEERGDNEIKARAEARSRELLDILSAHSSIKRVARNPLVLTVLSLLQREKGPVLPTRFTLFNELTNVLVSRRSRNWRYKPTLDVLGPLALWMQSEGKRSAHRDDVLRELRGAMADRVVNTDLDKHVDQFLTSAKEESGLLVERSLDFFGFFAHNVFREYFAAIELTRDPEDFVRWALEHLDDAHWAEVLLLGIASIGENHPTKVDDVLLEVLEASPEGEGRGTGNGHPYGVLDRHALLVGSALLEMERGGPQTVERIVTALVDAGARRRRTLHKELSGQIESAIAELLDSDTRERQVVPVLTEHLADDRYAPFVCDALMRSTYASVEMLVAVDAVCASPGGFSTSARRVRTRMVRALEQQGQALPPEFGQLGALLDEASASLAHLPEVVEFIRSASSWVDPPVYRVLRYLIDQDEIARDATVERLISLLAEEHGDGFDSLAMLGRAIDEDRVSAWVLDQLEGDALDPQSVAVYLTRFEPSSEEPIEVTEGAVLCALADMANDVLTASTLGFQALEPGSETFERAWQCLARCATQAGWIAISPEAVARTEQLIAIPEMRTHAELLLGKMRLAKDYSTDAIPLLRQLLDTADGPLRMGAAIALAGDGNEKLDGRHISAIGDALVTESSPLRPAALRVLAVTRLADRISDESLRQLHELEGERFEAGDAAAAYALKGLSSHLVHKDPARLRGWAEDGLLWATGMIHPDATATILDGVSSAAEGQQFTILEACLQTVTGGLRHRFDRREISEICERTESSEVRRKAAELFACTAVTASDLTEAVPFLERLRQRDPLATAASMRIIAWSLYRRPDPAVAAALSEIGETLPAPPDTPWLGAAVGLAVDAATLDSREHVLERLSARTAAQSEAARALLYSVGGVPNWSDGESLEARIADVAQGFASVPVGMRALLKVCAEPLERFEIDGWPERRGAAHLMYAAAHRHPALFVTHAPGDLRERLIDACRDNHSYSVRREASALMVRCPPLDDTTVALIKEATRDSFPISNSIAWRLRHRSDAAEMRDELVDGIRALLSEPNEHTIHSAAVLLTQLARRTPRNEPGQSLRARIRGILARRLALGDPILTIGQGRGILSLKETLEVLLMEADDDYSGESTVIPPPASDAWEVLDSPIEAGDSLEQAIVKAFDSGPLDRESTRLFDRPDPIGQFAALTEPQLELLNGAAYQLLEHRVGANLADEMRAELLDQFALLVNLGDGTDALRFIQAAHPNYLTIVDRERRTVLAEAGEQADELVDKLRELRPAT